MLRSWRAEPDGSYALVQRSISNGTAGRASLTTGFLLQPVVGNDDPDAPASTLLLWVAQLDRESVSGPVRLIPAAGIELTRRRFCWSPQTCSVSVMICKRAFVAW